MKQIAVLLAALLSLALVAPALAQPFADVPTDHWAYDAIAELAAKGLIEGYPDGAFRGDRAMTRYEMAMVVARLLARIEAIKIPPLPPDLARTKDVAAVSAALAATDKRLTAKLATVQRLVAEFRAELAALGVRVTAVEEELAAIRARLDNTRVTGDLRIRYNVYDAGSVSGGGTFRSPDARVRMRVTFTGTIAPNTQAVLRLWAANNTACQDAAGIPSFCGNYDVRFGNNYNFGVVSFDQAYIDVRNTWGANLWRVGRQFISVATQGPFGTGLLYDPANNLGTASSFSLTGIMGVTGTTGLSDGIRGDFTWGPVNLRLGVFRSSILAPPAGVNPGVGSGPALDHRVIELTTGALLPGWMLSAAYYEAYQHANCSGLNCSGGTGYSVGISGTIIPGLTLYGDVAWWGSRPTVGAGQLATGNAWRLGTNINLGTLFGITTWNPNIDFEWHRFGPLPGGAIAPTENYASTILGQVFAWNMDGYFARLNLTFSPSTRAFVMYEAGNMLCAGSFSCGSSGGSFFEWFIRVTHTLRPNTTLQLNYFRGGNSTIGSAAFQGDYLNFYRAELLYNW